MSAGRGTAQTAPECRDWGLVVTCAGVGINLALGVLYSWSVMSKAIPVEWGWTEAQKSLPYSTAILAFAFMTVLAGRLQDKIGPRIVATLGGVLTGAGLILTSQTTTVTGYIVGFGLLLGAGIGLGYAAATPPALKWCAPRRTGMIAGIVVAGFGLASVYVAPLATWLITTRGIQSMLTTLGIGFVVVVVFFAQFLRNPPAGFVPKGTLPASTSGAAPKPADNYNWSEMLATPQFYLLWVMYAFAAGAGLMIVGKLAKIVDVQGGLTAGFIFVAVLAVGNAGGRVVAGMLSDRLGRITTMRIVFLCQAALMILLTFAVKGSALASLPAFVVFSLLLGANYGANLAVFPSVAKDYFGLKNFGVNYGLIFTAWGVGGFLMPYISGIIFDRTHSFTLSYYIAASLLVVATALSIGVKPPTPRQTTSA